MYFRNSLESQSGEKSEALRLALYFERKAKTVTSAYSILADKALYQVVRTSLGLPSALSGADIEKQAEILTEKIDIDEIARTRICKKNDHTILGRYEAENRSRNIHQQFP